MIPLRDDNPTRITPYMTWTILAINIIIYFYQFYEDTFAILTFLYGYQLNDTLFTKVLSLL